MGLFDWLKDKGFTLPFLKANWRTDKDGTKLEKVKVGGVTVKDGEELKDDGDYFAEDRSRDMARGNQ